MSRAETETGRCHATGEASRGERKSGVGCARWIDGLVGPWPKCPCRCRHGDWYMMKA